MQHLELVEMRDGQPVTTSLLVAEKFGKQHKNVIRDIETMMDTDDFTKLNFEPSEYKDLSGKKNKMYYMTQDGFTLLAMGFTGKKALEFKKLYIQAFNSMRQQLEQPKQLSQVEILTQALETAKRNEAFERENARLAPKAAQYDDFLNDGGLIKMTDFAKASHLQDPTGKRLGRNTLFKLLRKAKVLFKNGTQPMQEFVNRGLFDVKQIELPHPKRPEERIITTQTFLTPQGQKWLYEKLLKLGFTSENQPRLLT